jgi:hypothetical protein
MAAYTTIDNPELYFQADLYTGNGTNDTAQTFNGDENMQPDMVWIKSRSAAENHHIFDSVRGANVRLMPNATNVDFDDSSNLQSFDSDGFTLGTADGINKNTATFVCWGWKGGGSASSNSDGDITTSISASTTAGFSIVSYTSNGSSNQTVGHGLGAVPHMIISKNRDSSSSSYNYWTVYHHSNATANDKKLKLDTTDAVSSTNEWGDTDPTSTVYSLHTSGDGTTNVSSDKIISYVFTSKQGYSKFGSYTGNGNADGAFIYTGFRPAFTMIKRTDTTNNWMIGDNKITPYNPLDGMMRADVANAELSTNPVDYLSNGFKIRLTGNAFNNSGGTYIYMAFAEAPLVNSNGVPGNAR